MARPEGMDALAPRRDCCHRAWMPTAYYMVWSIITFMNRKVDEVNVDRPPLSDAPRRVPTLCNSFFPSTLTIDSSVIRQKGFPFCQELCEEVLLTTNCTNCTYWLGPLWQCSIYIIRAIGGLSINFSHNSYNSWSQKMSLFCGCGNLLRFIRPGRRTSASCRHRRRCRSS